MANTLSWYEAELSIGSTVYFKVQFSNEKSSTLIAI